MDYISKFSLLSAVGIVGSFFAQLFGSWSPDAATLLIFIGVDFATGLIVAGVFKKSEKTESGALKSSECFKGLLRKVGILFCVMTANRIDISLHTEYIRTAVIIGFSVNELLSLVENLGLMGVKLPPALLKAIDLFKNKSEEEK